MADLEDKLSRADIIDVSRLKGDQVMFGATVTLLDEDTDEKVKYRVVGEIEADVKKGKISITSPLARALLGKRKSNIVEVSTPGGGKSYKVLKVEFK
jgi:transcription elongation factor GreA